MSSQIKVEVLDQLPSGHRLRTHVFRGLLKKLFKVASCRNKTYGVTRWFYEEGKGYKGPIGVPPLSSCVNEFQTNTDNSTRVRNLQSAPRAFWQPSEP